MSFQSRRRYFRPELWPVVCRIRDPSERTPWSQNEIPPDHLLIRPASRSVARIELRSSPTPSWKHEDICGVLVPAFSIVGVACETSCVLSASYRSKASRSRLWKTDSGAEAPLPSGWHTWIPRATRI